MSNYASSLEIINVALAGLGMSHIQDLSASSKQAVVASKTYEPTVRSLLSRHRWSFCIREETLTYQGTTEGKYSAVYMLPGDCISVVNITRLGVLIDYRVQGNKALCNEGDGATLRALYSYRAPEGDWADDFTEALITRLQAKFSRALLEDEAKAINLDQMAENMFRAAMVRDRRQSPAIAQQRVEGGRLRSAWKGA